MEIQDRDAIAAFIHLYRAEVGRMTSYRTRLDTTTNWAVGTTAAILSFALGNPDVPHFAFWVALALNAVFLWIESRRYRSYAIIRERVRLIEKGFYARVLGAQAEEGWELALTRSLTRPEAPITSWQAVSVRLRRNYLWLALTISFTWLARLSVHRSALDRDAFSTSLLLLATLVVLLPLLFLSRHYRPPEEG